MTTRLPYLHRGQEILVGGEWYPVSGYALSRKDGEVTGSVFTLRPRGQFEPCLGYRIDYSEIEQVREGQDDNPFG